MKPSRIPPGSVDHSLRITILEYIYKIIINKAVQENTLLVIYGMFDRSIKSGLSI